MLERDLTKSLAILILVLAMMVFGCLALIVSNKQCMNKIQETQVKLEQRIIDLEHFQKGSDHFHLWRDGSEWLDSHYGRPTHEKEETR